MKRFSVVGFLHDDGQPVEVVPTRWLLNDKICFWPVEKDKNKLASLIKNCAPPKNTWSMSSVKIYGKSNSFVTAGIIAEQALILSSLGSDSSEDEDTIGKRISILPKRYEPTSSEESEESLNLLAPVKKKSKIVRKIRNREHITSKIGSTSLHNEKNLFSVDFLEKILEHLIDIKRESTLLRNEIKSLREKVELKLQAEDNPNFIAAISSIGNKENFDNLPLNSLTELQNLEEVISSDPSKATSLARFLCRGGGFSNFNSLALLIMKRLLGRNVALQYSVEGRQEKLKFSDLNLFNVVVASIKMKFEDVDLNTIRTRIGKALSGASDWDGNRIRGKRKRKNNEEENCYITLQTCKSEL